MKNTFKLFVMITLVVVIGFSFTACDNGSTDSYSTNGVSFNGWNTTYIGNPGTAVISGGNSLVTSNMAWFGEEIHNATLSITITDGGDIKLGNAGGAIYGKYAYVEIGNVKKGILAYVIYQGTLYQKLGLGTRLSPSADGVQGVMKGFTDEGAFFDPPVDLDEISTDYFWAGDK